MSRLRLPLHLRPRSLALDAIFFVWLSYVVVSGHILPTAIVELIQRSPTASVVSEPAIAPDGPVGITDAGPEAVGRRLASIAFA